MTDKPIRVGFIGLNPGIHWAATGHIPALKALQDQFVVARVANTSLASAKNAANAFGLPHAFENAQALVNSPEIDLVVVTVKVPHHRELVTAALNAGKHVYCEWPLGNGLAEAQELADLADAKGVVAAVGTQMRVAPGDRVSPPAHCRRLCWRGAFHDLGGQRHPMGQADRRIQYLPL